MQGNTAGVSRFSRQRLGAAAASRQASCGIKTKGAELHAGDWVWFRRCYLSASTKWQKRYTGPYLVVRRIELVDIVIQRSERSKPFVVHVKETREMFEGDTCVMDWSWTSSKVDEYGCGPRASCWRRDRNAQAATLSSCLFRGLLLFNFVPVVGQNSVRFVILLPCLPIPVLCATAIRQITSTTTTTSSSNTSVADQKRSSSRMTLPEEDSVVY